MTDSVWDALAANASQTGDGVYSVSKFYTAASDTKGHSDMIRFPQGTAARIEEVINSGFFPDYNSKQAFIRDAVVHRLHQLGDLRGVSVASDIAMSMALESDGIKQRDAEKQAKAAADIWNEVLRDYPQNRAQNMQRLWTHVITISPQHKERAYFVEVIDRWKDLL